MGLRPEAPSPHRKTRWTALLVEDSPGGGWVSLTTTQPNRLVEKALAEEQLPEFRGWSYVGREVAFGSSRIDFLLQGRKGALQYLEVKSVTLVENGIAMFPDAVTARGTRHVEELASAVEAGHEATVLFVLQRSDADRIVAARSIDPKFSDALSRAEIKGVRVLGRRCRVTWSGISLGASLPAGAG